jgi:uncharacterized protein DUF4132
MGGPAKKRAARVTTPQKPSAKKLKPAPKTAARGRARADKPTIPIGKPVDAKAKRARASAPTKVDKLIKVDESGLGWVDAGKGYQLALEDGKLVCRNDKGKRLASVPKEVRDGDVADQLEALRDWLAEHDRECIASVEQWMLRSLPVPRAVLEGVWADPAWRKPLENAVVVAGDVAGLFRGVDAKKGVGIVDLDGETGWIAADRVAIPHPILISELDAWRELVTQLGVAQGIAQLHRETHVRPADDPDTTAIVQFADGKFNSLMAAVGKAKSLGYKVRGGFATCVVWDGTTKTEARYWIGADDPESPTETGQLLWVDARERGLAIGQVGPVAFSEGMRMASAIYAARVVEKQEST